LLVLALVVLLLFGATRLGDLGKGLGEGIRNFKKGIGGDDDESKDAEDKGGAAKNEAAKNKDVAAKKK
jgi:sec-independent protein translocase protein TatA